MNDQIENFIHRWEGADGTEKANYQLFLTELCELLELERPDPASSDTEENTYVFERRVDIKDPDGSETRGYIDLYKRGCFVLEAKQTGQDLESQRWDKAMHRARAQADRYIRALSSGEGRPPFLIVTDVGRSIELYSEFTCTGGTYIPFPDPRNHRIKLKDLRNEESRRILMMVWSDPLGLDPAKQSAQVTRDIAARLAELARSLEDQYSPAQVSSFLMPCLFTMFAEDVDLIPHNSFTRLLEGLKDSLGSFVPLMEGLWRTMNSGGFSPEVRQELIPFNGGLFADATALPVNKKQLQLLIDAARADWRYVEPAIFGTLLERALDPRERHNLGAHFTPRAYVERLVVPTIMEPLREEWQDVQAAATALDQLGKHDKAVAEIQAFHRKLCDTRVLDPACGSGNFLYVALEHMKRLEGEILNTLEDMGETQHLLELAGVTVDPHQFLGIEINPRAAVVAEMVLWIGYLQWHFRTVGRANPPEPVLRDFHNIECRDAVLDWDDIEYVTGDGGRPVTRWNGRTFKKHPVTGEDVPDETARVPLEYYVNPRKARWPDADFVVGNPPFIGTARMRQALGDGYAEAIRETYPNVPESADYVMYWWHSAAELVRAGRLNRFGFIATNSLRQTFNRRVVQKHLDHKKPLSLKFAIPDHPWVDSADGAAVRISMTVVEAGDASGVLATVIGEQDGEGIGRDVIIDHRSGKLFADLSLGANVIGARALKANDGISSPGVKLHGAGFIVTEEQAIDLGLGRIAGIEIHIRRYRNGRDLTQKPRSVMVLDLFGLTASEVQTRFPEIYQWILERVKLARDAKSHSKDGAGYAKLWWLFGKPRPELRRAIASLERYIATVETSKHRFFVFLDQSILPDNMLVNVAVDDALYHGVLSSRLHGCWALAAGGTLEDRPRYNKTRCFEPFPFPLANDEQAARIRDLAEQLDDHRKRQQQLHVGLTMTGMYNVLEKLRGGAELTEKEKEIHEKGLVSVLRQIHDDLDRAVFDAYGWSDLADQLVGKPGATTPLRDKPVDQARAEEELLSRLVELNAKRAAEEAKGVVRWLRPEFQAPKEETAKQTELAEVVSGAKAESVAQAARLTWPKSLQQQIKSVREQLAIAPMSADAMALKFKRKPVKGVSQVLAALEELGMVGKREDGSFSVQN